MNHTMAVLFVGCLSIGQFDLLAGDGDAEAIKALESKDVLTRRRAASYLQFMYRGGFPKDFSPGNKTKEMISALSKALADPDMEVRQIVAGTLGRFAVAAKPAVPLLADLLQDKEFKVRV